MSKVLCTIVGIFDLCVACGGGGGGLYMCNA